MLVYWFACFTANWFSGWCDKSAGDEKVIPDIFQIRFFLL